MSVDDLLGYLFSERPHPLAEPLRDWLNRSARFCAFVESYRDKIRKKVRTAQDADGFSDLLAELSVAERLLRDRRCVVEYEKGGVGKVRAPDLTVLFKTHTSFTVEVTRLRTTTTPDESTTHPPLYKLTNTVCAKVGQLPPSSINLLALAQDPERYTVDDLAAAMRLLLERANQHDDRFFQQRGLEQARHFQRQQARLAAIWLCAQPGSTTATHPRCWFNPTTKHPLPLELKKLLLTVG
jgi:hypothetical protein